MSAFTDMVRSDNLEVFCNLQEFGETRMVEYDGVTRSVRCVIRSVRMDDRHTTMTDHAQGLYRTSVMMHCDIREMDGIQPEKGTLIYISDPRSLSDPDAPVPPVAGGRYMRCYRTEVSYVEMGMLHLSLEATDE